jgi:anthranilate phosphoribosyltransferase
VGTGGDHLGTFNISTTSAFVAVGAGARVAKHGNRAASSRCGSADVLEALGVRIDLGPREVAACIDKVGMGFMLAAIYHPAAGRVAPVRRALGVRTVFNFLGPLTNPAAAGRQLMGVSSADYLDVLAGALARGGSEHALLVHGLDGMDEVSVTSPTTVVEVARGRVAEAYEVTPEGLGLARWDIADLAGGDPVENAAITRRVLSGMCGGPRDAVLANAAAALYAGGAAASLQDAMRAARESLDSGRAARVLDHLIAFTRSLPAMA